MSNDALLTDNSYQFTFTFIDPSVDSVIQPTLPTLAVLVKCTRSVDCSASIFDSFTYYITDSITKTMPACIVTPSVCQNTSTA